MRWLVVLVVALLASAVSVPSAAHAAADIRPKAVVIVGPTHGLTSSFLETGRRVADQAAAVGMDVRRLFHPKATWSRVLSEIQGANLVVYVGHGNGWPSPYGPFQERTKNGFGLNPSLGTASDQVAYHGADHIRSKVRLARGAVVLLYRLCYAAGNSEPKFGPEWKQGVAKRRVDNFAAGFLAAGASAVFAFGNTQRVNIPWQLANTSKTMNQIFRMRGSSSASMNDGFQGWKNANLASLRTPGARIHLDPHHTRGYYRALSGGLRMTAGDWRRQAGPRW
jgi:hypothetical protein